MGCPWRFSLFLFPFRQPCLALFDQSQSSISPPKKNIPLLQLLDPLDPPLRIRHHLTKKISKARLAQLRRLGAVEGAVVDGLAAARVPQTGVLAGGRI